MNVAMIQPRNGYNQFDILLHWLAHFFEAKLTRTRPNSRGQAEAKIVAEARWHWQDAAEVISPFIIFAVFDASFRRYKLWINYGFLHYIIIVVVVVA